MASLSHCLRKSPAPRLVSKGMTHTSQSHPLLSCFPAAMLHHLMDLFQSHVYEAPLSFRLLRAPFHSLFMSQMELSFPQRRLSPTHFKLVQCVIIAHSTLFFFFILISRSPLHCPPLLDRKFHLGRNHDIFVYLTSPVPTRVPGIEWHPVNIVE